MKKLTYLLLLMLAVACSPVIPPDNPNRPTNPTTPDNPSTNPTTPTPTASFSFKKEHPLTVILTNNSRDAKTYVWDFGDGTTSTETNPTHRYNGKGVYKITLTAKNGSKSDTYSQNVTLENPTQCYFNGITYIKLNSKYYNKYIAFRLIDDDFFTTTWVTSNWKLLSSANLPYDYIFNTPVYMNGLADDDWYELKLYASDSNTKNVTSGTNFFNVRINTSRIMQYPTELTSTDESSGTKVKMYFTWK